ncbi:hypothetical protein DICPUDRAFT_80593 [Dictyostelium purpureum]|uniref:UspA domain-containing protein n=1 Tax=Dictyostelium purpureum TaxID=5786 RepID=F0ZQY4_DICPU|nr:uncharacterized protein DICPUDRAFT_80593 [Dictyostelium purpureum]EGC33661.1 hypothetical protein DICPUDRAFT_80593 [Dictyostelium purpureum]|eukprot:XP_003289831.1 hypothetical protein DICPUDRAFT_80593 [Dictyostelium purpureum]
MNRYMICLDGSNASERGFHYLEALAMTMKEKVEVYLLNVVDTKLINKLEVDTNPEGTRHSLSKRALDEYSKSLTVNNIRNHELLIDTKTSVKDTILDEIEKNKIDMVIVGHAPQSKFKRIVDGSSISSVCDHLLKKANCPILIFK